MVLGRLAEHHRGPERRVPRGDVLHEVEARQDRDVLCGCLPRDVPAEVRQDGLHGRKGRLVARERAHEPSDLVWVAADAIDPRDVRVADAIDVAAREHGRRRRRDTRGAGPAATHDELGNGLDVERAERGVALALKQAGDADLAAGHALLLQGERAHADARDPSDAAVHGRVSVVRRRGAGEDEEPAAARRVAPVADGVPELGDLLPLVYQAGAFALDRDGGLDLRQLA